MDTIYKTYRAECKEVDLEDGSLSMFIPVSTDSVDRDGEVVEPLAFKKTLPKFMKRPVLVASHDYRDLTSQIGEWTKLRIIEGGIEGKPKYYIGQGNEQADWGFKLASKGMAAFSIGFIPKVWEDGDGVKEPRRTYKEVELLEISQVIVPSNREAIQSIRSKGVDPVTDKLMDDVDKVLEELVTKPEETENFIRIPVDTGNHEGHRIRTITISEKEGISAIYCGTDKVIMTYLFRKDHGWTMAKARAWVKEHEKSVIVIENIEIVEKGAIPYKRTPLDETGEWDAGKEVRNAEVDDLKIMCAIVEGDPENKTSYKLPHHRAGGEHSCVWAGVRAATAVLMGARGGVDAPAASIAGAKTHIGKHYADFDKGNPPWEKGVSQEEIIDEFDYLNTLIVTEGINDKTKPAMWILVKEILRLSGADIPVDIRLMVSPIIETKPKEGTLTISDILEAIKRIASK